MLRPERFVNFWALKPIFIKNEEDDPSWQPGAFAIAMVLILALFVGICRTDLPTLANLAISVLFAFSLFANTMYLRRRLSSFSLAVVGVFAAILLLGYMRSPLPWLLFTVLSCLGLYTAPKSLSLFGKCPLLFTSILALAFALLIVSKTNEYGHPFLMAQVPNIKHDTLFHAAVSSMLKNYSSLSTGLHGILLQFRYYPLSHLIIAATSNITGLSILDAYGLVYTIAYIPFFIFVFLALAQEIAPARSFTESSARVIILYLCFQSYGASVAFEKAALWDSYIHSESYLFSLILYAALLAAMYQDRPFAGLLPHFAIALCKTSVALVSLPSYILYLLFFSKNKASVRLFVALLSLAGVLSLAWLTSPNVGVSITRWFDFSYVYGRIDPNQPVFNLALAILWFYFLHFIHALLALALLFITAILNFSSSRFLLLSGITILTTMVVGALPGVVWTVASGSAFFFSNVAMFAALPILLGMPYPILREKRGFLGLVGSTLVVATLAICSKGSIDSFIFKGKDSQGSFSPLKRWQELAMTQSTAFSSLLKNLIAIQKDPTTRDLLVHIAPSDPFWNIAISGSCHFTSFLITALSERPGLFAFPPIGCKTSEVKLYGYIAYQDMLSSNKASPSSEKELLAIAMNLGFHGYIEVNAHDIKIIRNL